MLRRTCILLTIVTVSSLPVICGEPRSQSTMSGNSGYSVQTSSHTVNGVQMQEVVIDGKGISDHLQFKSPASTSLSVFNSNDILMIADQSSEKLLIYSDTPGSLVIMQDGVCKEKTYHGTSSTSRQLSEGQCQAIKRKASAELKKNQIYWQNWSDDFNKNMQDSFPPGFPFHNQAHNSASSMFSGSGNFFSGLANLGRNMQKSFYSGFPFNNKK